MLSDEEFDLIAASHGTLSITPSSDMLMQFGTFPGTGPGLERGIVSGFGVDTICSVGTDLFSEMRLALAAERSRANAPALARGERVPTVALHQRDMLRLATLEGAQVWNMDGEIGSLTPGKQADIITVDMRSPDLDGYGDPSPAWSSAQGPPTLTSSSWPATSSSSGETSVLLALRRRANSCMRRASSCAVGTGLTTM